MSFRVILRIWHHYDVYCGSLNWLPSNIIQNCYAASSSLTNLRDDCVVVYRVNRVSNVSAADLLKIE